MPTWSRVKVEGMRVADIFPVLSLHIPDQGRKFKDCASSMFFLVLLCAVIEVQGESSKNEDPRYVFRLALCR